MEGLQKLIGKILKDPPELGSASASFEPHRGTEGLAAALSSSDQSRILLNRPASAITVDSAMTAHEVSSSSSSKSKLWNYDVFLSFSGEDTRRGFTGHLHQALVGKGYNTFMDEDDLKRGKEIRPELLRAIEESRISIIVFSKKYADSSWCLDELVKIMECGSKLEQHVLPIFYHVDPSDIRKQKGSLAPLFQKHEEDIRKEEDDKKGEAKRERLEQWREALTEAANLSGYDLKNTENGYEAKVIKKIIYENLWEWLPRTKKLHVAKFPVGINSRVQEIITYLSSGEGNEVLMVGIWGMGGLGKTTAAKAIYNQIHHEFEFKSFLADVSDTTSKHGLVHLQRKLSFDIMDQEIEISTVDEGICRIEEQFSHRRVLIIMDNIDGVEQLNAIAGNHKWFGPGSRIIITTRDKHLLLKVDKVYSAQILNKGEALELFSWHAFGNSCPNEEYLEVSKNVVSYCGGLPLALEVLGTFLCERPQKVWNSQLEKLERIPNGKIIKPLRISFDGLDDTEKATFLNISCFFIGEDEDHVTKLLDVCGFFATVGINVLRDRCLVTVEDNKLNMHDLLREMAKVIISEKSPGDPGKWSRLWNREDVTDVLTYKSGTEEVGGLALNFPYPWPRGSNMCSFSTEAFANMKKLRLLHLKCVQLNGEYKHLPKELIWLRWEGCPLKSIPNDFFNQDKLLVLEMRGSSLVQVWEGSKSLHNLKILDLSKSWYLQKSPDFSQVPNLEELILEYCFSLSEIHPSLGHLKRLSLVNLKWCHNLISLPRDFYKSKSVETLLLNGCSNFREVHEDIGEMISLRTLETELTAITQVPHSIVGLKNLTRLSLDRMSYLELKGEYKHLPKDLIWLRWEGCPLKSIPDDFFNQDKLLVLEMRCSSLVQVWEGSKSLHNLKTLDLSHSYSLQKSPDFSQVPNLKELILKDCNSLSEIHPSIGHLKRLSLVNLRKCCELISLPRDFYKSKSVETLLLDGCWKFREVHEDIREMISLRTLEAADTAITQVPPSIVGLKNLTRLSLDRISVKHTTEELIQLRWEGCPLKSIPNDFFNQDKLLVLEMRCSSLVQVWEGFKSLHNLKTLDLSNSWSLQKSPNFSQVPNLERLILKECESLFEIHPSIGHLKRLSLVNLQICSNLRSLPRDFYKSKSVETLLLNYCSKFRQVHEDLGDMISLRILETNHTAIRQVPPSILRLKNLTRLSLSGVKLADDAIPKDLGSLISLQDLNFQGNELHTLPNLSGLSKLETLWLSECKQLHTITDLPTNLKFLLAQRCPALETMPSFSEMSNMRELIVSDSPKVIEVPGLDKSLNSMTWINMKMCTNLSAHLRKNILEGWTSCGFGGIFLNGNYVPDWFEFVNEGTKVTFDIPDGSNFEGLTLFCLYRSNGSSHLAIIVINNTQRTELRAYIGSEEYGYPPNGDDYLLQGQLSNNKLNLQGGDKVDILFENPSITIKRTGVNLVWGKDKSMKENMHDLDKAGYVFDTHPTRFYDEGGPSHDASDNNRPRKHMRTTIDD
ncbi:disease resistance protein RPV1-like isoform X3 [Malus sylvestris]|uniref:disease resistance protein RPV1-like isoform X3 n=1 Tax=Malus sylvestris TaxID=3752 RepID=UPI0021ACB2E9|nr:disease resistance protein RPV1-like isoform X3 [Malus sylvestris]